MAAAAADADAQQPTVSRSTTSADEHAASVSGRARCRDEETAGAARGPHGYWPRRASNAGSQFLVKAFTPATSPGDSLIVLVTMGNITLFLSFEWPSPSA